MASTWGVRTSFQVFTIILFAFVISVLYFTTKEDGTRSRSSPSSLLTENHNVVRDTMEEVERMSGCDYFSGKWVFDNQTYPLYKEKDCTFMSDQLACQKFGRKDLSYQYLRWQPYHCNLPRFSFIHSLPISIPNYYDFHASS